MQVVVGLVHRQREAAGCLEGLPVHGRTNLVDIGRLGLLHRLLPHVDADISGFHRVVGDHGGRIRHLVGSGPGLVALDELVVLGALDRHEVVPGGKVTNQRLGVDAAQLFLTDREGHDRHILGLQTLIAELFVERDVGVAIDGRDHRGPATRCKFLDVGNDGLIVGVTERGVDLFDVFFSNALRFQEGTQNLVGGAGIDIVGADQEPALGIAAALAHQIFDRRNRLLIRGCAGVKHVFR